MTGRLTRLRAYRAEVDKKPAVIGVDDCGPWVAEWIRRETASEIDFPKYTTAPAAYVLAEKAGGLVALVDPLLTAAGLWPCVTPEAGDVGVIQLSDRETAGIFCGNGFVLVRNIAGGARPMRPLPKYVLKAWSLP